jgi:hypothetical protein
MTDEATPISVITGEDGYTTVCFGSQCVRIACAGAVPRHELPIPDRSYFMTLAEVEQHGTGSLPPDQPIILQHDAAEPIQLDDYLAIATDVAETERHVVIDARATIAKA